VENNSIYTGYLIDILTDISTYIDFTYILSECTGGIYGMKVDGLWSGCIGDLVNNVSIKFMKGPFNLWRLSYFKQSLESLLHSVLLIFVIDFLSILYGKTS
jgi:hypothetical protein